MNYFSILAEITCYQLLATERVSKKRKQRLA